jgi:NTP pyrophosphatase (non-canonical NTP hydrolase)
MKINNYIVEAYETAKSKGWYDEERSFGDLIALTHCELSEALEEHRNDHDFNEIYYNPKKPDKPEGIPIELADALIRIFDMCGKFSIDLEKALELKLAYNKTRPYRHGGKVL